MLPNIISYTSLFGGGLLIAASIVLGTCFIQIGRKLLNTLTTVDLIPTFLITTFVSGATLAGIGIGGWSDWIKQPEEYERLEGVQALDAQIGYILSHQDAKNAEIFLKHVELTKDIPRTTKIPPRVSTASSLIKPLGILGAGLGLCLTAFFGSLIHFNDDAVKRREARRHAVPGH
jgi:hypothetical protein